MSPDFAIRAVPRDRAGIGRFLRVPYGIYDGDPHWVAPLLFDLKKVFTRSNPLFEHAEMHLWVAERGGRDVGRIAAIVDHHFNRSEPVPTAFWGFFECVNDRAISTALFEAAAAWARHRGLRRLLGPMNPTSNDECGLLVEGFDSSPTLMMTYNPRYYVDLVEAEGFRKTRDLLAFYVDISQAPLDRLARLADKVRRRYPELVFSPVRRKSLATDLGKIKEVYNSAWQANWGFTPMTDPEIDFLAGRLKPMLVEGLVWVVEFRGEPVGFMLAVPDYNQAFKPLRGRLLTPRLFGALPYLLQRKFPTTCRVITLGTKEAWRNRGLESVMLSEGFKTGFKVGFKDAEASWILEDNEPMVRLMGIFGGHVYKRYRLYDRAV
jgi:GNAT superfamily N-acetyltransferase